jgi:hypothetical protein
MSFMHPNSNFQTLPMRVNCFVKFRGDPKTYEGHFNEMKTKEGTFFVNKKDGKMRVAKPSRLRENGEIEHFEII